MISRENAKRIVALYDELDEVRAAKKKLRSLKARGMMTVYVGDNDDGVTVTVDRGTAETTVKSIEALLLAKITKEQGKN